jgi:hypothetical protein
LKGFELSYDDEVPEDVDQGQPGHESPEHGNDGPDIPILQPAQPPAVVQLPPFDLYQCIRRLGGHTAARFETLGDLDSHLPSGPTIMSSERARGSQSLQKKYSAHCSYFAYFAFYAYCNVSQLVHGFVVTL